MEMTTHVKFMPLLVTILFGANFVASKRIAILNDVHLNLTDTSDCRFPYCYDNGQYNLDSPSGLLDTMLEDLDS